MTIENLKLVLSRVPVGKLPPSMTRELFELVTASWHEFSGSHEASMKAWKINRDKGPEDVTWNPPCLGGPFHAVAPTDYSHPRGNLT
jgi:hypothetical protein